ncbi:DUF3349 domain-containing protein [Nocardioides flavescens]|uniref:DUF3349 domain-containing protein n=1 Tax=Nocardioides flavescens TaxID=2691959 RepID=A0A6L7F3S6_9ACTN|nr:DUF3349 domain-containing protein [Nocardioides flavescens]MXG91885.1 DUF3349 domain-containing protein [Nocardioides flavescens]
MTLNSRLTGVLEWLREGYPAGVPPKDYIPLLALLRTRLTEAEVREVAQEVAGADDDAAGDAAGDIGVQITKLTDALPAPEDVARVEARLVSHHGWPVD